jgi:opacity protein-like surface antigen
LHACFVGECRLPFAWSDRELLAGFVYGAGAACTPTSPWGLKAELLLTQTGDGPFSSAAGNVPVPARTDLYNLRVGVNIHF